MMPLLRAVFFFLAVFIITETVIELHPIEYIQT